MQSVCSTTEPLLVAGMSGSWHDAQLMSTATMAHQCSAFQLFAAVQRVAVLEQPHIVCTGMRKSRSASDGAYCCYTMIEARHTAHSRRVLNLGLAVETSNAPTSGL